MITQVRATFDQIMTLNPGFFLLERLTPGAVPTVSFSTSVVNGGTRIVFTFSGPGIDAGHSLQDGLYRLTLFSANILTPANQPFDGNGDGAPGGNFIFNFHRFFGDADGNRTVDGTDFAQFGARFGLTL